MYDDLNINTDLETWRKNIENDFRRWLSELTEAPEIEPQPEVPDMYSFYQELCVIKNEIRKGGRRNQDVFTRFGESLSEFQKAISDLHCRFLQIDNEKREKEHLSRRAVLMPLIDIFERMERLKNRLDSPPRKVLFRSYNTWKDAWSRIKDGYEIIYSYVSSLLKKEGITKIETVGMPFDPTRMTAVAVEYTEEHPADTVIEEISPGFLYNESIMKLAEVKISKMKEKK